MAEDCIFCQIIEGDIPSRTVYEDSDVLAFLDVNPLQRGHTLVVPKQHAASIRDMEDEDSIAVFRAVHDLVEPVTGAVDAPAFNLGLNDGGSAGQEVPHVHFHIVPRFRGDGGRPIHAVMPSPPDIGDEELDEIMEAIRGNV